jgi:uncharacterized membrane protein YccC
VIIAIPAAVAALIGAARGHWILALALIVIALAEARADTRLT